MSSDQREAQPETTTDGNGTTTATVATTFSSQRLRINPNNEHRPESYEDLKLDFPSAVYSSLEKYLPPHILVSNRDEKVKFMTEIMLRHLPHGERSRAQRHSVYRQKIITNYQPLHKELYTLVPKLCFVPSFIKAIDESSEKSFRNIISEPSPGIFVFDMLLPSFCQMMLAEIENFEKWVGETKFRIMRPNTMNKYVFFSDVGGATLDSHHGFVVEYGKDKDLDLGFHVDDSEVTLNVCLGNKFVGGELFFRGTRCERHVNTTTKPDEIFDYPHVPGQAVLHRGRNRHGARATTSGHRVNMLLWCRSSVFRELKSHQKEFSSWCGECFCEKKEEKGRALDALRKKLVKAVRAPQA